LRFGGACPILAVMLSFIDPDPLRAAILLIAMAAGAVVLSVLLWRALLHRSRRFGGGVPAAAVMAVSALVLLVAITPDLLPFEVALPLMLLSLAAILRPGQVVAITGGPSLTWRALREGAELQRLVFEAGGPAEAGEVPEIRERVQGLESFEGPATAEYVGLLRETLLADPERADAADRAVQAAKLERLATVQGELRASLGARPVWERELERRAAAGGPADGGPAAGGPADGGPADGGPAAGGPADGGPAAGGPSAES